MHGVIFQTQMGKGRLQVATCVRGNDARIGNRIVVMECPNLKDLKAEQLVARKRLASSMPVFNYFQPAYNRQESIVKAG